jgi:hypothetical protein
MPPSIYLISKNLTEEQIQAIVDALSITPLDLVLVTSAQDVPLAKRFSETVTGLHRPIAILADFEKPLTAVTEDGTLEAVNV